MNGFGDAISAFSLCVLRDLRVSTAFSREIVDLARQLIELSGLNPDTDIEIKFTGLRPGEKFYEELNHKTENMVATEHAKVMRFLSQPQTLEQIQAGLDAVQKAGASGDTDQFKLAIKALVPEYQPYLSWNTPNPFTGAAQPAVAKVMLAGRDEGILPPACAANEGG